MRQAALMRGNLGRSGRAPRRARGSRALVPLVLLLGAGCENRLVAYEGGVMLADADQVGPAQPGPRLVVREAGDDATLAQPTTGPVRVAIERQVPWRRVRALLHRLDGGAVPYQLLVGNRDDVRTFVLSQPVGDQPSIELRAYGNGQFCIRPPESAEAYCVQGAGGHIPRAFVRETLREAVKAYQLTNVTALLDPDMQWADAVRAIDGARTCCPGQPLQVAVGNRQPPAPTAAE